MARPPTAHAIPRGGQTDRQPCLSPGVHCDAHDDVTAADVVDEDRWEAAGWRHSRSLAD